MRYSKRLGSRPHDGNREAELRRNGPKNHSRQPLEQEQISNPSWEKFYKLGDLVDRKPLLKGVNIQQ